MTHTSYSTIAQLSTEPISGSLVPDLRTLESESKFATAFKISHFHLSLFSNPAYQKQYYSIYLKQKKSGGERKITAPADPLKEMQRRILSALNEIYKAKPSVHGFVNQKSIVTNASDHSGKKWVLNVDLQDFFPSLNIWRVKGMLAGKPYYIRSNIASLISKICCFENSLPQGAPTSPILSNMICGALDSGLQKLAREYNCTYTRYADDLTFSSTKNRFPSALAQVQNVGAKDKTIPGPALEKIIRDNGFIINQSKVRLQSKYQSQVVTGLKVNQRPNVKRTFIKNLRAILHAWETHGYENAESVFHSKYYKKQANPSKKKPSLREVVFGQIQYIKMVKGEKDLVYRKIANWFYKLTNQEEKNYFLTPNDEISAALWVIETAFGQGTAFMVMDGILLTCQHVLGKNPEAFRVGEPNKKYLVEIVEENVEIDLAVIKILFVPSHSLSFEKNNSVVRGETLTVAGFPDHGEGSGLQIFDAKVTGFREKNQINRVILDTPIFRGNSGGPVLNKNNKVVGIAVTGAENVEMARDGAEYGVIPISALKHFTSNTANAILLINDI